MIPIYFPMTYIPEPVAQALHSLFGPVTVLQPVAENPPPALGKLAADGLIHLQIPCAGDGDKLVQVLEAFYQWGRLHHGSEISLKAFFETGTSQDSFTAQIKTDILKNGNPDAPDPDPLFPARLFLLMAQDLDARQNELTHDLAASEDAEKHLFSRIKGDETPSDDSVKTRFSGDSGSYRTGPRLSAWCRLFKEWAPASGSFFLVTDSRAAVEEIREQVPELAPVGAIERISCRQPAAGGAALEKYLAKLAAGPLSGGRVLPDLIAGTGPEVGLRFYALPDADAGDFCCRIAGQPVSRPGAGTVKKTVNTVVVFIEI